METATQSATAPESSGLPDARVLTSGSLLARNAVWNFAGQLFPLLAAVIAIPRLVHGLGTERFGVLSLAWVVTGYFGLFDFGVGRALTKYVAEKLGTGEHHHLRPLTWTALAFMLLLGIAGGAVLALLTPWLVHSSLKIPAALRDESAQVLYLLAFSVPVLIITAGLRGVLDATQRFAGANTVRALMGPLSYLGPLALLAFWRSLVPIVALLVVLRTIGMLLHGWLCLRALPQVMRRVELSRRFVRPLLVFGGWMTVTNIIGPLMVNLDRFLIAAYLSMSAVAYYTTPYEVVTKLLLIPGALIGVLFPAFSTSTAADPPRAGRLYLGTLKYLFLALFPLTLAIVTLAPTGLRLWLGAEFALHSTAVLQWLAVGVFINSLAQVPFALVQAGGRPDLTAKLHLIELPLYLVALRWLALRFGVEGVAVAWVLRVTVDMVVLLVFARRVMPSVMPTRGMFPGFALGMVAFVAARLLSHSLGAAVAFLGATLATYCLATWFLVLHAEERAFVLERLNLVVPVSS